MAHAWEPRCDPPRGLVPPVRVGDGPGEVSRGRARGPGWRPVGDGLHVPRTAPDVPEQRILEQAARLRGRGAVTGWAALRLAGAGFFDGLAADGRTPLRVPLVAGDSGARSNGEALVVREELAPHEVVVRHGVRCVSVERAVAFAACRSSDLRGAVVTIDMALAAGLTTTRRVARALPAGGRGVVRAREALRLADGRSRSPAESRLRLVWVLDAGRPPPLCNARVLDEHGRLLGVPDLLDPDAGVVGEFDGAEHRTRERHRRDVAREDAFRRAGLETCTAVGHDLHQTATLVDRIGAAYERAGARPRRWRLGPPDA